MSFLHYLQPERQCPFCTYVDIELLNEVALLFVILKSEKCLPMHLWYIGAVVHIYINNRSLLKGSSASPSSHPVWIIQAGP